jgi:hypothetical protein
MKEKLWELVISKELNVEEVDILSIMEIDLLDALFQSFFCQQGDLIDIHYPLSINYIRINKKIDKLNL